MTTERNSRIDHPAQLCPGGHAARLGQRLAPHLLALSFAVGCGSAPEGTGAGQSQNILDGAAQTIPEVSLSGFDGDHGWLWRIEDNVPATLKFRVYGNRGASEYSTREQTDGDRDLLLQAHGISQALLRPYIEQNATEEFSAIDWSATLVIAEVSKLLHASFDSGTVEEGGDPYSLETKGFSQVKCKIFSADIAGNCSKKTEGKVGLSVSFYGQLGADGIVRLLRSDDLPQPVDMVISGSGPLESSCWMGLCGLSRPNVHIPFGDSYAGGLGNVPKEWQDRFHFGPFF